MTPCDIILTDAGNEVGFQVLRLLAGAGYSVLVCDRNPESLQRHAEYAAQVQRTLAAQDERNFVRQVRKLELESGAGIIIPVFYPEVLSRHRDEFDAVIPTADAATLSMLDDKVRACSLASELGIPQPRTYASPADVDRYPVVFKRACGHGGDSVYFPKSLEPLEHLVANSRPGSYLITEEVHGYDASVDAIRWNGRFSACAYKVLLPRAKGISIVRRSMDAPQMVAYARRIMEAVGYEGVCGFDFRVTPEGDVRFLECNPRFTGGVLSSAASGLNLPVMLCDLASGREVGEPRIRPGKITVVWRELMRRTFSGGFRPGYLFKKRG